MNSIAKAFLVAAFLVCAQTPCAAKVSAQQLSATRWDHEFKLHTDRGDTDFTLNKGAMQGYYLVGADRANSAGTGFTTYWYFDCPYDPDHPREPQGRQPAFAEGSISGLHYSEGMFTAPDFDPSTARSALEAALNAIGEARRARGIPGWSWEYLVLAARRWAAVSTLA